MCFWGHRVLGKHEVWASRYAFATVVHGICRLLGVGTLLSSTVGATTTCSAALHGRLCLLHYIAGANEDTAILNLYGSCFRLTSILFLVRCESSKSRGVKAVLPPCPGSTGRSVDVECDEDLWCASLIMQPMIAQELIIGSCACIVPHVPLASCQTMLVRSMMLPLDQLNS